MAALDDGLYDVGGEICEPQEPADMRFAEAMALRNLGGIGVFHLVAACSSMIGRGPAPG